MDKDLLRLPVLSIRQPWAWLIVNGYKDIENRTWPTRFRGKVLIHAGKKWDEGIMPADIKAMYGIEVPRRLETGGIVGIAEITDCVKKKQITVVLRSLRLYSDKRQTAAVLSLQR